jgi:hypothetical protein
MKVGKPSINLWAMADEWRTVSHNQRVSEISMESWISVVCHLNNDSMDWFKGKITGNHRLSH